MLDTLPRTARTALLCILFPLVPLQAATLDIGATAALSGFVEATPLPDAVQVSTGQVIQVSVAGSSVDDPATVQDADVFVQIGVSGNPGTPFIATAFDETSLGAGNSARGFYLTEVQFITDPNDPTQLERYETDLIGTAALTFGDLQVDANADSGFESGRDIIITNTFDDMSVSFLVRGGFDVALTASADDVGSSATSEAVWSLALIGDGGLNTPDPFFVETTAYAPVIDDADAGTSVTESLVTSNALFDGVNFQASVSAEGTGAPTEASLTANYAFSWNVQLQPGSTARLRIFSSQSTVTSFVPAPAVIPLPGSVVLLFGGMGLLGAMRRKAR